MCALACAVVPYTARAGVVVLFVVASCDGLQCVKMDVEGLAGISSHLSTCIPLSSLVGVVLIVSFF